MKIFISYAKKDTRRLALALAEALNALDDVSVWVDESLRAGRAWELQIEAEIDRCDTMIVLLSPDINRHKQGKPMSYVLREVAYARDGAKKPVIPVMAQQTPLPISLMMEQYIDFTLDGLMLDDLVKALCWELDIQQVVSPPSIIQTPLPVAQTRQQTAPPPKVLRATDILPAPFAWIEIPGGHGTLKTDESDVTLSIPAERYWIAKYPTTNAQFAKFIEAGGYERREWWTDAGWEAKLKGWHYDDGWKPSGNPWTEPRYWQDSTWNGAEQPVVGVSWYEAVAFCLWLSDVSDEKIMLPSEDQWQYAAQGDDGRKYPWGNKWDGKRCNNSAGSNNSKSTTPVTQYEGKGDSPFGVVDMAGNVWEWCLTDYENKTNDFNSDANSRVLRGGAWNNIDTGDFRAAYRNFRYPYFRNAVGGFRCARSYEL